MELPDIELEVFLHFPVQKNPQVFHVKYIIWTAKTDIELEICLQNVWHWTRK